jgi:hypothetical protein
MPSRVSPGSRAIAPGVQALSWQEFVDEELG